MNNRYEQLFALLRAGLKIDDAFAYTPSAEDWRWLHAEAGRQSVTGVAFAGLERANSSQKPPLDLLMRWAAEAQNIKRLNIAFDIEAKRMTELIDGLGMRSTILKGQGNALMYPAEGVRTPGDIDIFAEGGKQIVASKLNAAGILAEQYTPASHHVHIKPLKSGISVEVHVLPSSGLFAPWHNKRLQKILHEEILRSEMCHKGFRVRSVKCDVLMHLAHLWHHCLSNGIGIRHIIDFYVLLRNASSSDIAFVKPLLPKLGMCNFAKALMWLLTSAFKLDDAHTIASPDYRYGALLMNVIAEGGNFGKFARSESLGFFKRMKCYIMRRIRQAPLAPAETVGESLEYIRLILITIPKRISQRRLALTNRNNKK